MTWARNEPFVIDRSYMYVLTRQILLWRKYLTAQGLGLVIVFNYILNISVELPVSGGFPSIWYCISTALNRRKREGLEAQQCFDKLSPTGSYTGVHCTAQTKAKFLSLKCELLHQHSIERHPSPSITYIRMQCYSQHAVFEVWSAIPVAKTNLLKDLVHSKTGWQWALIPDQVQKEQRVRGENATQMEMLLVKCMGHSRPLWARGMSLVRGAVRGGTTWSTLHGDPGKWARVCIFKV